MKWKTTTVIRLLGLLAVIISAWGFTRNRLSLDNWSTLLSYSGGDEQQILCWIKAASEGDYTPFLSKGVHRLGAPYQANWNDYPMYEELLTFCLGTAARCIGLMQAANLGILLGHCTSALAFYFCCRALRHRRIWSFVGAVLFSFTHYNLARDLPHLLLAYSYTVPLAILSGWLVLASKGMRLGNRLGGFCLVTAAVMGLSNPYNLNMYLQLLVFSTGFNFLIHRRKENLRIGLLSLGVAAIAFISVNLDTIVYGALNGKNSNAVLRNYSETELYALKPIEFVVPPTDHHIELFGDLAEKYASRVYVRGELFSPYLGIIGIVALVWMLVEALLLLSKVKRVPRRFPAFTLQAGWIMAYSVVGGVNCILALAGLQLFRGSNRYSIFISAIVLLFLISRLSVLSRRWSPSRNLVVAILVCFVGLVDQLPRATSEEQVIESKRKIETDRLFGRQMEEHLPAGTMVFQMPVMPFPDAVPAGHVLGYEMVRPFLFTKTLRFSFGSNRGRAREIWQWEVERMPAAEMVRSLERFGFGAIYINRRGFPDNGVKLIGELQALGKTRMIEDNIQEQVCISLNPNPNPEHPPTENEATINFNKGWTMLDRRPVQNQQWAGGNAALTFFNPGDANASYVFSCGIGSLSTRRVTILQEGRELWSESISAGQAVSVNVRLTAKSGNNRLEFKTDQPADHPPNSPVAIAFTVMNARLKKPEQ